MNYPKVSIITPSYNQGAYIEETIQSVLNQNYPNLEYIIIDGGSTDNSVDIINKYETQLAYWISEKDDGMYHAIQKGFKRCTGEIMGWINSDDILAVGSLFTISQIFLDYPQISWLNGVPNQIDEDSRIIEICSLPHWNKWRYFRNDYKFIQQEGAFWRTELWGKAGGYVDTNLQYAGDLELWSRFFQYAELHYVNTILGSFRRRRKNQKTLEHLNDYNKEALDVIKKMPISEKEQKYIDRICSKLYKGLRRRRFKVLFNLMKYNKIASEINKFPPTLYYNVEIRKFTVREKYKP